MWPDIIVHFPLLLSVIAWALVEDHKILRSFSDVALLWHSERQCLCSRSLVGNYGIFLLYLQGNAVISVSDFTLSFTERCATDALSTWRSRRGTVSTQTGSAFSRWNPSSVAWRAFLHLFGCSVLNSPKRHPDCSHFSSMPFWVFATRNHVWRHWSSKTFSGDTWLLWHRMCSVARWGFIKLGWLVCI